MRFAGSSLCRPSASTSTWPAQSNVQAASGWAAPSESPSPSTQARNHAKRVIEDLARSLACCFSGPARSWEDLARSFACCFSGPARSCEDLARSFACCFSGPARSWASSMALRSGLRQLAERPLHLGAQPLGEGELEQRAVLRG